MDALIQTILKDAPETVTSTHILQVVPRFIQEAQTLAIPGADKKAVVLKALHDLVDALEETPEMHAFVDVAVAPTIDMLMDVAKGRVSLTAPKTVEEVSQKVNCFLQVVQVVLGLLKPLVTTKVATKTATKATEAVAAAVSVEPHAVTETAVVEPELPTPPTVESDVAAATAAAAVVAAVAAKAIEAAVEVEPEASVV